MKKNDFGFTLIELIIAITILSIIMISVFTIFTLSSDLNNKVDISRSMQENIKNIVQIILEDIRNNKIKGVNSSLTTGCQIGNEKFSTGTKLCLVDGTNFYLAKKISGTWVRVIDYKDCNIGNSECYLVKETSFGSPEQLSNSWVEFRNLYFYVSNSDPKKVTINFEIQPSTKKGINLGLIKSNKINFQTTIGENIYNN